MTTFKFEAWPTEFRQINQYFGVNPQNYAGHEALFELDACLFDECPDSCGA